MAQLGDEPFSKQAEQHRLCRTPMHLVSRSVIGQVVPQHDVTCSAVERDHEVAPGIVDQRFTLSTWTDGEKAVSLAGGDLHRATARPLRLEASGIARGETTDALLESRQVLLTHPVNELDLVAKDIDLLTRQIAQDRLVSKRANDAPLCIDPVLEESAQCLPRAKQPRLLATQEQEAYGWIGGHIENDTLDAQVRGLHLSGDGDTGQQR